MTMNEIRTANNGMAKKNAPEAAGRSWRRKRHRNKV